MIFAGIESLALALYIVRDAHGGLLRYLLARVHLDALWFVPDLLGLVCLGLFLYRYVLRTFNMSAFILSLYFCFSLLIGYIFLGSTMGVVSAFKMVLPAFVGFCFCRTNLGDCKRLLVVVELVLFSSIAGIFLTKYMELPWVGFSFESAAGTREASRVWWTAESVRLSGFASDSTIAGFFVMLCFVLTSIRRGLPWCLAVGGLSLFAINLTTSKTSVLVLFVYLACLVAVRLLPEAQRAQAIRTAAFASFGAIAIPIVLILVLSGADLMGVSSTLFSLQDRINNSWQLPFFYLQSVMPTSFVTGCGLGCYTYPQELFSDKLIYYVPVDNFYIGSYLMFGPVMIPFVINVMRSYLHGQADAYRCSLMFIMNLFSITVLCYSPSTALAVIALGFSGVFATASIPLQRRIMPGTGLAKNLAAAE